MVAATTPPGAHSIFVRLAPARPTPVFDSYWHFAAERQEVFFRRLEGDPSPWTADPIIQAFKFTNAYRASDRVSQYLIRNVIYRHDLPATAHEITFRVLLFKLFNRIETWELLEAVHGPLVSADFDTKHFARTLERVLRAGRSIYSAAYIMPPAVSFGFRRKHSNHLALLANMMRDNLGDRIAECRSMQQAYDILLSYPYIGSFLAYQFVTDLNYAPTVDFSETEFVVPGPGAKAGLSKCFQDYGGLGEEELIRLVADRQEAEFEARGIRFRTLWGRRLQLIDCQNVFCEVDKYARVKHPHINGRSKRTRIKQAFSPASAPLSYWYPPKWQLNDQVRQSYHERPLRCISTTISS